MLKKVAILTAQGFSVTVCAIVLFSWLIGINQHNFPRQYFTALAASLFAHIIASWITVEDLESR